jgi:trafficking protein particle complex subunit 4
MPLLQLFIINRNGGLVYNKPLNSLAPTKSVNDMMVLGSTFHSLYEIIKQIAPVVSSEGIEVIETAAFKLHCYQVCLYICFSVSLFRTCVI